MIKDFQDEEEEQKQPAELLSERLAPLLREHSEFTLAQEAGSIARKTRGLRTHHLAANDSQEFSASLAG